MRGIVRTLLLLTTAFVPLAVASAASAPGAAAADCSSVATKLRRELSEATSKRQAADLVLSARVDNPGCTRELNAAVKALADAARPRTQTGTPFLGPIGWLWNEVYYTIFQGRTILMVMFGWELLLAPFVLLFCGWAVFRGTAAQLKKPYVPPEIRTNES